MSSRHLLFFGAVEGNIHIGEFNNFNITGLGLTILILQISIYSEQMTTDDLRGGRVDFDKSVK